MNALSLGLDLSCNLKGGYVLLLSGVKRVLLLWLCLEILYKVDSHSVSGYVEKVLYKKTLHL